VLPKLNKSFCQHSHPTIVCPPSNINEKCSIYKDLADLTQVMIFQSSNLKQVSALPSPSGSNTSLKKPSLNLQRLCECYFETYKIKIHIKMALLI
jgi:hypothetical protein